MAPEPRWTVVTWNLQGTKRTDLDRVAGILETTGADVLMLQEIRRPQAIDLADRFDMQRHWVFKHHAFTPFFPDHAEGLAILTPHRLHSCGSAVVSDSSWRRHWRRRIVVHGLVERRDGPALRIFNLHLSPHDLRRERLREADRVTRLVERFDDGTCAVIGGDLNDHGDAITLDHLPGVEYVASPPTNPAVAPANVLDHVLLPDGAHDVELVVPAGGPQWDGVSDHLPVTVSFSPPAAESAPLVDLGSG